MLTPRPPFSRRASQQGVVLLISLIVLVALTLGALALTRSVYTSNAIAGNIAFQQAATHSADTGIEDAIAWLENNTGKASSTTATPCSPGIGSTVLACDQTDRGYIAHRQDPTTGQSWAAFWSDNIQGHTKSMGVADNAGNTVDYIIQRMCSGAGDSQALTNDCTVTPKALGGTCASGSSCDSQKVNLEAPSQVYYRITVRVTGPRNTQSYVQAMVAL